MHGPQYWEAERINEWKREGADEVEASVIDLISMWKWASDPKVNIEKTIGWIIK